ncbi:conserved protein of unknown function [Rhodovastum atsumiense]|uniref:DUF1427 family protein n=1 Tax=Rhodovastum atsumiense TaxID=504468 RepID=A0A5M6ITA3_9PROT|nr:DUF1427 family protein [Rhodovastum atsumiense]KAA5611441.1 DUF1427 family protein [Rhodovastum atsumiense]CAH2601124.1 conserved protein of unknown function [Rhodovastum atsumiense]
MMPYVLSVGAGLVVGILYGLVQVRSPAPPVIALVGLLGMLLGEQVPPLVRCLLQRHPPAALWQRHVRPHVFGSLPAGEPVRQRLPDQS